MKPSSINISKVSKVFGGTNAVRAIDDVDLTVEQGQFVAIVGPSGCGKSTLLNLVAGFEKPSSGTIEVNGRAVKSAGPDRAVVFQEAALFPWLSVWENVVFGPKMKGSTKDDYAKRAEEYIRLVGLENFRNHLPHQLSGGMRQRVGIARTLVMEPELFLMDEPFGALDAQTRMDMQELLLSVWEERKRTVLFITHDIDEAILLADVVYVMTARPGKFRSNVNVELPRPRSMDQLTEGKFVELKKHILSQIRDEAARTKKLLEAAGAKG